MPLYEYQCDACAHRFEVIQKFSDDPISVCPSCGGVVHKLLSSPAIQFKGSGWYITDYARGGKTDSATTGSGDKPSTSSGSGDSKDAKSDSKESGGAKETSASKPETKGESPKPKA